MISSDIDNHTPETEPATSIEPYLPKKLNDNWVLWYHNPNDTNWDISSYKVISKITTIDEYWNTYEFIKNNIIENSMLFIMREGIQPLWEDPKNIDGGCWSFKITKGNIKNIGKNLPFTY